MNTVLSIGTGALIAVMIRVNGTLQGIVGALPAITTIHVAGMVSATALATLVRSSGRMRSHAPGTASVLPVPPRSFLLAGLLGIPIVFLNNEVYLRGGVLLTLSGSLAGQVVSAWFMEGSRWLAQERSTLLQRMVTVGLLLPGTILIGIRSGAGALWVILSWVPGVLLMVQSMMNTANGRRFGVPRMLTINYGTALVVLLPWLILTRRVPTVDVMGAISPVWYVSGGILGVAAIGLSSVLFRRSSAVVVVLSIYAGQIGAGTVLDLLGDRPPTWEQILGALLVVAGMAAGDARVARMVGMEQRECTHG